MQADIKGTTMPVLEITLQPGEEVVTTHGELSWMTPNVQMSQTTGGGSGGGGGGGLMGGLKRMIGGGSLFLTRYQAEGGPGMVAFAAKLPGHIMPVDIAQGQAFMVHRHGWLCGTEGVVPGSGFQQGFRAGMYGGDGFHLVALTGPGQVWLQSMPLPILAHALQPYLTTQSAAAPVEGGVVGGIIGNIMRGQ
ncbi:MAG TPA: AIM24 family protein [Streptosporangiaceae bacterium]